MATTNRKSTTKKKTSKAKKTAKSANKSASARTTTRNTTAKKKLVSRAKTSAKKSPKSAVNKSLNTWNWIAAMFHAASGAVIILISDASSRGITTSYLTQDTIASTDADTFLTQATRNLFDVNLVYLLAGMFFIAAIAHVVAATVYRKNYEADIKSGVSKTRWIEYGIGGGVMLVITGILSGISDLTSLSVMFDLMIFAGLLGLTMELYKKYLKKTSWFTYIVSVFSVLTALSVIKISFMGAYKYGEGSLPSHSYWAAGIVVAYLVLLAYVVARNNQKKGKFADYVNTEKAYIFLSFTAKSALAWQIYFAILN